MMKCIVAEGIFEIYYVSMTQTIETTDLIQSVLTIFQNSVNDMVRDVNFISSITIVSDTREHPDVTTVDIPSSPMNMVLITVLVVCSTLIAVAIFIITRGRKSSEHQQQRSNYSQVVDTTGIIPDRHIRSDDSVSNSPTISSNGRAATTTAGGWDDGLHSEGSQSDSNSDTSSRPSFTVQLEEASQFANGIEATRVTSFYQVNQASYLPSSVLKDLLDRNGQSKSFDMYDTVDL